MIDPAIIRQRYASMTDDELLHFAKEDNAGLTDEAVAILTEELKKRHFDITNLPEGTIQNEAGNKSLEEMTVDDLRSQISKYEKSMTTNGLIVLFGLVVTAVSYLMVADKGGKYLVFWGAVIFGGARFFISLAKKIKYEDRLQALKSTNAEVEESN